MGAKRGRIMGADQLDQENREQTDRQTNKHIHPTVTNSEMLYVHLHQQYVIGQQAIWFVRQTG